MGPNSLFVLVGVLLIAVGLLVAVAMNRRVVVKVVAGALTLFVTTFWGALVVNAFYGYYSTWSAAIADLSGSSNSYALHQAATELHTGGKQSLGRLVQVKFAGSASGISRDGLVYFPPQYYEPQYRTMRFPVVELIHGTPGDPGNWIAQMGLLRIVSQLTTRHEIGPMVLVMPDINGGLTKVGECVDSPTEKDDAYVAHDIRADMERQFRVTTDPYQWGLMGYSSGGYCAANLALRHRTSFGAFAALDGYYRPSAGPAQQLLGHNSAAEAANDPLAIALGLRAGSGPVPAGWVSAGTGNGIDFNAGRAFVTAMRRLEAVPFFVQRGAHHNVAAWRVAVSPALRWMWQQLASPDERARFPVGGNASTWTAPHAAHHQVEAQAIAKKAGKG